MTPNPDVEEIAKTRNWIAFGKALSSALDDPVRHGFHDQSHLLAHVAHLRGVEPSSLRNPLAAVNWLKQNAQKALEEENSAIPMTGVLTLSQISIVSSKLADELAPRFFSGAISRRELVIALRRAEADRGRPLAGHERMKRAQDFEDQVYRFLRAYPQSLELGDDIEIIRTGREALVPSDFTVTREGEAVATIECKSHRSKRHRRYLIETLAMAALRASHHQSSFLVVPETWDSSIEALYEMVRELSLTGVCIGIFDQTEIVGKRFKLLRATGGSM